MKNKYITAEVTDIYNLEGKLTESMAHLMDAIRLAKEQLISQGVPEDKIIMSVDTDYTDCYYESDAPRHVVRLNGRISL